MSIEIKQGGDIIIAHDLVGTPGQPDRQVILAGQQANPATGVDLSAPAKDRAA